MISSTQPVAACEPQVASLANGWVTRSCPPPTVVAEHAVAPGDCHNAPASEANDYKEETCRPEISIDRGHIAYAALERPAQLTVRTSMTSARRTIAPAQWKFNRDRTAIEMEAGFQPGLVYECTYQAANPRLQGAGLAAVRDVVSYFKYSKDAVSLLGDQSLFIHEAIGFGVSQSGRFLRTFLYYGMNEDEAGRKVFDGVWADVAGAGRGSFNHRFAQPSRDGYAFFNTLYQTDLFPFTDVPQMNPETGVEDGLLQNLRPSMLPKINLDPTLRRCRCRSQIRCDGSRRATGRPRPGCRWGAVVRSADRHSRARPPRGRPPADGRWPGAGGPGYRRATAESSAKPYNA